MDNLKTLSDRVKPVTRYLQGVITGGKLGINWIEELINYVKILRDCSETLVDSPDTFIQMAVVGNQILIHCVEPLVHRRNNLC